MLRHLKNIPLFNTLKDKEFKTILENLERIEIKANAVIFEAEDIGNCLYVITEGEVEVFIDESDSSEKIVLSKLSEGDYFGEMALITGEPRSASVKTITDCKLLKIDKKDFDELIVKNPSITISLSHMLSQRLKNANIKRAEVESIYQSKMKPAGKLEEVPIFEVLKFCEQNSLTGLLNINIDDNHAELNFLKGQLQEVKLNNLIDDQAMDEILSWEKGIFQIVPILLEIENKNKKSKPIQEPITDESLKAVLYFANQLIGKLNTIVGSLTMQQLVSKTMDSLQLYFPFVKNLKIKIDDNVEISNLNLEEKNGKIILSMGVFLQFLLENCKSHTIGLSFLNIHQLAEPHFETLKRISFFEYMSHASEFVTG